METKQTLSSEQNMSTSSRKRTPRGHSTVDYGGKDIEAYMGELSSLKKKFSVVRQDNVHLRTQVQKLSVKLKKKEKQLDNVLAIKVNRATDKDSDSHMNIQLQALKNEMLSISRLSQKVRDLEVENAEKEEELKLLKSSMKFTLIKELQIEAQTYFNEARRMKKILDRGAPFRSSVHMNNSSNFRDIPEGSKEETYMLRDEVKALRRELVYLKGERGMEDKSYNVLQRLRSKMEGLQNEIRSCEDHFHTVDDNRHEQERLATMLTEQDGLAAEIDREEERLRGGSGSRDRGRPLSRPQSASHARPQSAARDRDRSDTRDRDRDEDRNDKWVQPADDNRGSSSNLSVRSERSGYSNGPSSNTSSRKDLNRGDNNDKRGDTAGDKDYTLAEELSMGGDADQDDLAFDEDDDDYNFDD